MFDPDSRYHDLSDRTYRTAGGREILYKARRLLTAEPPLPPPMWEEVAPGDRPDLLSYRATGDSLLFWRLCEANDAADPFELTEARRRVLVPPPGV